MNKITKANRKLEPRGLVVVGCWHNGFVIAKPQNREAAARVLEEVSSCSAWDVAASNRILEAGGSFIPAIALGLK